MVGGSLSFARPMMETFENTATYRMWGEALRLICAFFWLATYVLVIRRGKVDRTPAMPLTALALNVCWEGIFSFVYMPEDLKVTISWGSWFFLDLVILLQMLRYGGNDFAEPAVKKHWTAIVALAVVTAFVCLMGFTAQFHDKLGWFAGFLQNLIMSILFVAMIVRRGGVRGQSLYIALGKFLGTFVAFILATRWSPAYGTAIVDHQLRAPTPMQPLIVWIYPLIFIFDALYVRLVYRKCVEVGINPWRRL